MSTNIELLPTGKHELTVTNVSERKSINFPSRSVFTLTTITRNGDIIYIYLTEGNPCLTKFIVGKFWPWYGQRLGHSITHFELERLIGKKSEFEIELKDHQGHIFSQVKWE